MRSSETCKPYKNLNIKSSEIREYIFNDYIDKVPDIEDLVIEGRNQEFCPYYFELTILEKAHVVILPLQLYLGPIYKRANKY